MKTRKQTKQGISLIVLVITIIVMIILAAAIILSLSSNGIIDRANEAVEKTDEKQMQTLAQTLWAEAYLDYKAGKITESELIKNVKDGLEAQDKNYEEKYVVEISKDQVNLYKAEWETLYVGDEYTVNGEILLDNVTEKFNAVDKYRVTLESDEYTGMFVVDYVMGVTAGDTGMFYLAAIEGVTRLEYTSGEELLDLQQNSDVVLMRIQQSGNATYCYFDGANCEYKIKKIERVRQTSDLNEYGFKYNTWYNYNTEDGSAYIYFYSDNLVYTGTSLLGVNAGIWYFEEGTIKIVLNGEVNVNELTTTQFVPISKNELASQPSETGNILKETSGRMSITKNSYGAYTQAIYVAKDTTLLGENITIATLSISITDNEVYKSKVIGNNTVDDEVYSGEPFNTNDYSVSADGKTIIDKTGETEIEYVLLEDIYELK